MIPADGVETKKEGTLVTAKVGAAPELNALSGTFNSDDEKNDDSAPDTEKKASTVVEAPNTVALSDASSKSDDDETSEATTTETPGKDAPWEVHCVVEECNIRFVRMEDVDMGHRLGNYTKCGSGYEAEWNGKTIAVKRYNGDSFHRFKREIDAYYRMTEIWGELIPEPYFVSYDDIYIYFGMQLGREPTSEDMVTETIFKKKIINKLRQRYGFTHCSPGMKHCKFLPGKDGEEDKMIAIDLENQTWY